MILQTPNHSAWGLAACAILGLATVLRSICTWRGAGGFQRLQLSQQAESERPLHPLHPELDKWGWDSRGLHSWGQEERTARPEHLGQAPTRPRASFSACLPVFTCEKSYLNLKTQFLQP